MHFLSNRDAQACNVYYNQSLEEQIVSLFADKQYSLTIERLLAIGRIYILNYLLIVRLFSKSNHSVFYLKFLYHAIELKRRHGVCHVTH